MVFIISLSIGAYLFANLGLYYLKRNASSLTKEQYATCAFPSWYCEYLAYNTWVVCLVFWSIFNCIWIVFLVGVQSYQIAVNRTTNETANYYRFDYLVHPEDRGLPPFHRRFFNPFDLGIYQNCLHFWTGKGRLQGIDWHEVTQVPVHLLPQFKTGEESV
jgi:hypothetical protein